jgi:mannose-6-phosphate isomerase-like protein (cupin superfamily)
MNTPSATFESFREQALASGHDEALLREWAPHFANELHTHPFDTHARVARGEFWLTIDGRVMHLKAGDTFDVAHGVEHSERYGPEGAIFWAARRNPSN